MKTKILLAIMILGLLSIVLRGQEIGTKLPQFDNLYVNDFAALLNSHEVKRITNELHDLKQNNGIELTLITIENLEKYNENTIEDFATKLFNHWGIGDAFSNKGVLILISKYDRKMRIEIGDGFDRSLDSSLESIVSNNFLPFFKKGDYPRGIEIGTQKVISTVSNSGTNPIGFKNNFWSSLAKIHKYLFALLLLPIGLLFRYFKKPKVHNCRDCGTEMYLLPEHVDDNHLDGGQVLEEYLNSVNYKVWECETCDKLDIIAEKKWFSSLALCTSCRYTTLKTDMRTINYPSEYSQGLKELKYRCQNCGFHDIELRSIPRKKPKNSVSSFSNQKSKKQGSRFGGGKSSGRGASGSW